MRGDIRHKVALCGGMLSGISSSLAIGRASALAPPVINIPGIPMEPAPMPERILPKSLALAASMAALAPFGGFEGFGLPRSWFRRSEFSARHDPRRLKTPEDFKRIQEAFDLKFRRSARKANRLGIKTRIHMVVLLEDNEESCVLGTLNGEINMYRGHQCGPECNH